MYISFRERKGQTKFCMTFFHVIHVHKSRRLHFEVCAHTPHRRISTEGPRLGLHNDTLLRQHFPSPSWADFAENHLGTRHMCFSWATWSLPAFHKSATETRLNIHDQVGVQWSTCWECYSGGLLFPVKTNLCDIHAGLSVRVDKSTWLCLY